MRRGERAVQSHTSGLRARCGSSRTLQSRSTVGSASQGDHFNVGTDEDRRRMGIFRGKADAVFVGKRPPHGPCAHH